MNLEEKFNILVNKMNFGHYDEVIFETSYLIKNILNRKHYIIFWLSLTRQKGNMTNQLHY